MAFRQSFMVEGMGYCFAGVALPTKSGTWGADIIHYGNSDYHEQKVSIDYAMLLGRAVSAGVAFHYLHSGTSDAYYTPQNMFTFSLALQYLPSDRITVGFKAFNPIAVRLDSYDNVHIPAMFNLGMAYAFMDELIGVAEVEKQLYRPSTLRFGVEYCFYEQFFLCTGISTNPVVYSMGFRMQWHDVGFNMAAQMHQSLGFTPQLSLNYQF